MISESALAWPDRKLISLERNSISARLVEVASSARSKAISRFKRQISERDSICMVKLCLTWSLVANFILIYFERTWGGGEVDSVKMPKLPGVLTLG